METFLVVIIVQAIVTFVLLWSNRKAGTEDFYLALLIVVIVLHTGFKYGLWLLTNDQIFNTIHSSFSLLYGPLLLFYYRKVIDHPIPLRKTFIHYIPFLILSVFNLIVIYLLIEEPAHTLITIYSQASIIGALSSAIYGYYVLIQTKNHQPSDLTYPIKATIVRVICFTLVFPMTVWVIVLGIVVIGGVSPTDIPNLRYVWYLIVLTMLVLVLHYRFRLFRQNLEVFDQRVSETNAIVQVIGKKYQNSALHDQQREKIVEKLTQAMTVDHLFLDSDLSLESMASRLDLPKHHITEVLNDHLHTSFYQFINTYRVEEAQRLIRAGGPDANLTAICFDSGFKSKSTFNKYFKETTGLSPSEYRSQYLPSL